MLDTVLYVTSVRHAIYQGYISWMMSLQNAPLLLQLASALHFVACKKLILSPWLSLAGHFDKVQHIRSLLKTSPLFSTRKAVVHMYIQYTFIHTHLCNSVIPTTMRKTHEKEISVL